MLDPDMVDHTDDMLSLLFRSVLGVLGDPGSLDNRGDCVPSLSGSGLRGGVGLRLSCLTIAFGASCSASRLRNPGRPSAPFTTIQQTLT